MQSCSRRKVRACIFGRDSILKLAKALRIACFRSWVDLAFSASTLFFMMPQRALSHDVKSGDRAGHWIGPNYPPVGEIVIQKLSGDVGSVGWGAVLLQMRSFIDSSTSQLSNEVIFQQLNVSLAVHSTLNKEWANQIFFCHSSPDHDVWWVLHNLIPKMWIFIAPKDHIMRSGRWIDGTFIREEQPVTQAWRAVCINDFLAAIHSIDMIIRTQKLHICWLPWLPGSLKDLCAYI